MRQPESAPASRRWRQALLPTGLRADEAVLTTSSLWSWMQAAAGAHATALGLGFDDLCARGLTWMLSRFRMEIRRPPAALETLEVATWPSGATRLLALRELVVAAPTHHHEPQVVGTSAWLLVDSRSRRPVRPGPFIDHLVLDERALELSPKRLVAPSRREWGTTYQVQEADIDFNGHVTNTRYVAWIEDALRQAAILGGLMAELEIDFVAEVLAGQHVRVSGADDGTGRWRVVIEREEDGATVAVARVRA